MIAPEGLRFFETAGVFGEIAYFMLDIFPVHAIIMKLFEPAMLL